MLPTHMSVDVADDALGYFVPFRNFSLRDALFEKLPNRFHFEVSKLRIAVLLAYRHSSLSVSILQILFLSSKKQVRRIAARWVVALVTNMQSFWNWTVSQFVRNTRRGSRFSFYEPASSIIVCLGFLPRPTTRPSSNLDLGPKSFFNGESLRTAPSTFSSEFSSFNVRFPCPFWHGLTIGI